MSLFDWLNQNYSLLGFVTTWLEILGFITGAICVYLNTQQIVWGWLFGIVNAVLYFFVFWNVKLYADMGLQLYYFTTSIYGWWMWLYGGANQQQLRVTLVPKRLYLIVGFIFVACTLIWGYLLNRFTDASLSYADSALTVASLIAQWMMARKYVQNWLIWVGANLGYIVLYSMKDLYLTSLLYVVFLILAISGYRQWKRDWNLQHQ